ncbi:phosphate acetyltransferase [Mycoplasma iguanae]|uniref:Phosphate acetyltransferase n=1 Tax=Mycoplasma iguanae TaxID=292461 RepID=A0ABY5RC64_9MOLU|nr:phosphate acetyltransferase [Mycoplasma iguanae]UVD81927.1 phosphate acetyltransferase [Mycoplasma iguanae]
MSFIQSLEQNVAILNQKEGIKKILLIDGDDKRAQEAAKLLKKTGLVEPVLLLEKFEVVEGVTTIVMEKKQQKEFAQKFFELRKGKETEEAATKAMETRPFYAMMLLQQQLVDGVVGGLLYTTGDILRAAFKIIGAKPGIKTISSAIVMAKGSKSLIFSDISVNINPNEIQLHEIGLNAADFAKSLELDPKVAFLSFSTDGSAISDETKKVVEATRLYNEKAPQNPAIGEVQFDAALDLEVRKSKYKKNSFAEVANVLIFPDLNSGNIGYKIAQRLGDYEAIGPIITGINKPVNDLSRGATVNDVYGTVLITTLQTKGQK